MDRLVDQNYAAQINSNQNISIIPLRTLVQWSLYKYKCLWDVGGKGQDLSLQEEVLHTYTLRLG